MNRPRFGVSILAEYDPIAQAGAAPDSGGARPNASDLPEAKSWLAKDPHFQRAWILATALVSFLIALSLLAGLAWQRDQHLALLTTRSQITLQVITPLQASDREALIAQFRLDPAVVDARWLSEAQLRDWLTRALDTKLPPMTLSVPQFVLITRDPADPLFENRLQTLLHARQIAATIETPRALQAPLNAIPELWQVAYAAQILGLLVVWSVMANLAARALVSAQARHLALLIELGGHVGTIAAPILRRLGGASLVGAFLGAALAAFLVRIVAHLNGQGAELTGETPLSPGSADALSLPALALSGDLYLVVLLPVFCAIISSLVIHRHVTSVLRRLE